ncbi:sce7725 family protein [Sphingobacterium sp. SRCM116780]|uniref:sce7725 family protein n=1 Tax=Sphingobacterium sp. SRCM116780 TaxID=2907623 RepID=UPI001F23F8FF|nr:sce7725 family protein [Sphingobacterium sp. SRCM116780]UIR54771.1 sce7725 family protein [Sphingobacterium sp. SRCM116780]
MYFPYLRGKQFELIALRELAALPLNPNKIIPIVEPVKIGLKSISTALKVLKQFEVKIQLIVNPKVGQLVGKTDEIITFISEQIAQGIDNIIPTFLIEGDSDVVLLQNVAQDQGFDKTGYALIHMAPVRKLEELSKYSQDTTCLYNTIHINHVFALRRKFRVETLGILGDYFRKQRVNADYANDLDESFSSDCFYYRNEGFAVFSDYQSIGDSWIEGGMLPKAVVIHLTYRDPGQDEIRIHHFVSNTNDDTLDVAGKFYEALTKLVNFCNQLELKDSLAIKSFRDLHAREAFPGLGVVKKLSIMHHIELIQGLI